MKTRICSTKAQNYRLNDFLHLHDKDFLLAAYTAVMKRNPALAEESSYLRKLRNGVSRERILERLAGSEEAINNGIVIRGLRFAVFLEKLKNIPVLGILIMCAHFICSSRRVFKKIRALENRLYRFETELKHGNKPMERHYHDLDNLIMSLPVSLRKITHDISEIKFQLGKRPHEKDTMQTSNGK